MVFSMFTLITAIIWISVFTQVISFVRKRMFFFRYFSIYPLLIMLLASILRITIPIEFPYSRILNSTVVLPLVQSFLNYTITRIWNIQVTSASILLLIWMVPTVVIMIKRIAAYTKLRHLLRSIPATKEQRFQEILLQVGGGDRRLREMKIIKHSAVNSPAVLGIFRPIFIFPEMDFTDTELLGIFIHEWSHCKYGHFIIKWLGEMICAVFWWNPLFRKLSLEIAHSLELQSDKNVCRHLSKEQQKVYLNAIAKVAGAMAEKPSVKSVPYCLVEDSAYSNVKQRFTMVLEGNYLYGKRKDFVLILITLFVFFFSYTFVIQPHSEPKVDDYGEMEKIPSDYYLIQRKGNYDFYDAEDNFIGELTYIDETLSHLKVYVERKQK